MKFNRLLPLTFLSAVLSPAFASAQSYYDDDIYYDASKASQKSQSQPATAVQNNSGGVINVPAGSNVVIGNDGNTYIVTDEGFAYPVNAIDFPSSEFSGIDSGSMRDVDEYNRRYQSSVITSKDSVMRADSFANTRNIERFSNPDIVLGSGDDDLIQYYIASQPSDVNIYINNTTPAYTGGSIYSPYYWNSWAWNPWYYSGWYSPYWSYSWRWDPWYYGPSWSWGWGYDPWYWGGPSWGWSPGWHDPYWHPRPQSPSGASRPHRPNGGYATNGGGYRGSHGNVGTRPSSSTGGYRGSYGSGTRPSYNGSASTDNGYRPSTGTGTRPSYNSNYRPNAGSVTSGSYNGSTNRGSSVGRGSSGSRGSSGGGRATYNDNNNRSNYNNSSTRSSSGSSYRSGGTRSGSHSSGAYRGGGGGGRGSSGGGRGGRH